MTIQAAHRTPPVTTNAPKSWLADPGQLTPGGFQATYRSSPHALMGLRFVYREQVLGESDHDLRAASDRYQQSWERFAQHGDDMTAIVARLDVGDVDGAAAAWNAIDQGAVNAAFRTVLGEREPHDGRNLATHVWRTYDLNPCATLTVPKPERARALSESDSNKAWNRSGDGRCRGCGTATISPAQRNRLHKHLKSGAGLFDVDGIHRQHNGVEAPLWPQVTIAAKAVAEHVVPRCHGGPTDPSNLTNACSGCNYSPRRDIARCNRRSRLRPPAQRACLTSINAPD